MAESQRRSEFITYCGEAELHGVAWFSTVSQPCVPLKSYVQSTLPIIHNYPLVLALAGALVEENYVSQHNVVKRRDPPAKRFSELGVYAYPLQLEKVYLKTITMSMSETDLVIYKTRTRLAIPLLTRHTVMLPETRGWTVVISTGELPREMFIRLGVKRLGVWRITLQEATLETVENRVVRVESPFNTQDVSPGDYAEPPVVVLKHYAGDVAVSGSVKRALLVKCGAREVYKPAPLFINTR